MNFITPLKYNCANKFHNGFSVVSIWDKENKKETWLFIDKNGKENRFEKEYAEVCNNSEDMFRVSTLKLDDWSLAYHSDYRFNASLWGYADINGKIIKPQYIFAFDFDEKGLALVCKGEWEWTNEDGATIPGEKRNGGYWSDEQLWGMIDKTSKEVIP
jgi:hypothetical protein